ncbi:DegT/DnrJ/EryC1/StrS family aminotransferase [Granulibacter bethesdensis]|uniref:dTDP-6-deoxy-D-xylo-hex-3-ulose 3-aminotransferase n=1 Tax=Granulibacter bethesdensis (strain ATCC BAA-1260 / CGDNIH1) TaxID=391165 RepID=Q0BT15_GRABC|nr:DegT/DnrJ/EryC1/StrS family aminotransferase [Granulibacter bethesdensis]ABI62037.1 dTDP-6-deoxy-D-xylo-hex-3-ulose 3-aminotransferase [Granulibacter bethesdensis CGDNIH1]APH51858.1 dTDP-6-deoxy-D-xylo-hex-3-ulose 3-aminotransferase [Granulibacter bethesdensis]APH64549.1 dTDP-6-deoxy-D-xylo-hex-3-ulose 3-aminotransferase [Granulibacter bethesdensis]
MSDPVIVPQADPRAFYLAYRAEIDAAISGVLASGSYILGEQVSAFENEFAIWLGRSHAIACGSATDGLVLALRALGVGAGCSVATVSHTAVAVIAAIEMAGAQPLLLDINPADYCMNVDELTKILCKSPDGAAPVRAVIPVHLYGQSVDMTALMLAAKQAGIPVIEDCSQAHGGRHHGKMVGTYSTLSVFSLYPTKNLCALGDAGIVSTDDPDIAETLRRLRQYGWGQERQSELKGVNSRMDDIQASILSIGLACLDQRNSQRQMIARSYDATLRDIGGQPPCVRPGNTHVYHQYVIRVRDRDVLRDELQRSGVQTAIHYPYPVHSQPAYRNKVMLGPARCVETVKAADTILSLPMFPELESGQVEHVCAMLRKFSHLIRQDD